MPDINQIVMRGRLAQEPELKYLDNGSPVCNARLAVNEIGKDGKEYPTWHRVEIWGSLAEELAQAGTGDTVKICGKIKTRSWPAGDHKHYATDVVADMLRVWPKKQKQDGQQQPAGGSSSGWGGDQQQSGYGGPPDDDIPC